MEKIQDALNIQQAADGIGADRATIYRAISRGELPAVRVKGTLYVLPDDLSKYKPRVYGEKRKEGAEE